MSGILSPSKLRNSYSKNKFSYYTVVKVLDGQPVNDDN